MVIIGNEQIVYIWLPRTWSPERFANNGWQRGQENMWPSFAINQSEPKGWSLQFLKRGGEQRDFFSPFIQVALDYVVLMFSDLA